MAAVTSKLQVTIPKAIADRYGLKPGSEIDFVEAGDVIRVVPPSARRSPDSTEERLREVDRSRHRQRRREEEAGPRPASSDRGWTREDLYEGRGRPR